jgi:CHAT domain-containing protein
MQTFYKKLQANPAMTKSEALREAQLDLLGQPAAAPIAQDQPRGAERTESAAQPSVDPDLPPFAADSSHPYAHPYYWAPFVLIGNWK